MGKPEHLAILKAGVEKWNAWRRDEPWTTPDLSNMHLNRILCVGDQSFLSVSAEDDKVEAEARGIDLGNLRMGSFEIRLPDFSRIDFRGANLAGTQFGGVLVEADFSSADLRNSVFTMATLFGARFVEADLAGTDLRLAKLRSGDFRRANLESCNFQMADLREVAFGGANLRVAHFENSTLFGANFTGAAMNGAMLARARLGDTNFGDNDLSSVAGLELTLHAKPSVIGVGTIYKSKGGIDKSFLEACGASEELVRYVQSYREQSPMYHSCFLSHSSEDKEFAERLYQDLRERGVVCWFAPEDLKIGDRFRDSIEEAIRGHEKLLLVLSQNSIESDWVETEVETAFARERREGCAVLFPIMVDDTVFDSNKAWAADIGRTRHIGDFRERGDDTFYRKGLDRLLRDLKVSAGAAI